LDDIPGSVQFIIGRLQDMAVDYLLIKKIRAFFPPFPVREGRIGREGQASQVLTACEAF